MTTCALEFEAVIPRVGGFTVAEINWRPRRCQMARHTLKFGDEMIIGLTGGDRTIVTSAAPIHDAIVVKYRIRPLATGVMTIFTGIATGKMVDRFTTGNAAVVTG